MNLEQYQSISGITVGSANTAQVTAQINRTRIMLEDILGYSLSSKGNIKNLYNEIGILPNNSIAFDYDVDIDNLLPPEPIVYAYRLYSYNSTDLFWPIDPFNQLNAVKLVYNNITVYEFDLENIRVEYGRYGFAKYIQPTSFIGDLFYNCNFEWSKVQIAVDAQWLWENCLPQDLLWVWIDMINYYADCKQDVMTEAIGRSAHSYTKFPTQQIPEQLPRNLNILKRYAGPYGSLTPTVTIGGSKGVRTNGIY